MFSPDVSGDDFETRKLGPRSHGLRANQSGDPCRIAAPVFVNGLLLNACVFGSCFSVNASKAILKCVLCWENWAVCWRNWAVLTCYAGKAGQRLRVWMDVYVCLVR